MNRLMKFLAAFGALTFMACSCADDGITDMRCEYIVEPVCIGNRTPYFTWRYDGRSAEDFVQSSYTFNLFEGGEAIWSSGVLETAESRFYPSEELPLEPSTCYLWEIVAESEDGTVLNSKSSFRTALFDTGDWIGEWISDGRSELTEESPVLRKEFILRSGVESAVFSWSAAAYADILINGRHINSSALNPGYTHYHLRNLYLTANVKDYLVEGTNVILAVLGNGFYDCVEKTAVWEFENAVWKGRPRMICNLDIRYGDGASALIGSDSSWQTPESLESVPYRLNNIYSGDHYDLRLEDESVALAGYDTIHWRPAVSVPAPSGLLVSQYMPSNEVDGEGFKGRIIKNEGDTLIVVDFGKNISGRTSILVEGSSGTNVKVRHTEAKDSLDNAVFINLDEHFRARPGHSFQTDRYVLRDSRNKLEPAFNYHGFRYAEIKSDKPLKLIGAKSYFVHTDFGRTGSFECSDETLNSIRDITERSYLSNYMGIPTDCPQREKNGWTADAHISCEIGFLNFDCANAYLKWIDDIVDNQTLKGNGEITAIIPSSGWGYGIGPVWDAAMFVIPEALYNYYGDIRGIERITPACEKYLEWLRGNENEEGIITYGLGDWVPYYTTTPSEFTSTCYYWYEFQTLSKFESLLGNAAKAEYYGAYADIVKERINRLFFDPERALYANGSQCAQALPLYLGIVPEGREADVARKLSENVAACDGHLDFGMIGSKTVLRVLTKYGYADQAYEMIVKKDAPSWAYWLEEGRTTPPELWTDNRSSMNHVFLCDLSAWMTNDIAGINFDPSEPGFKHIIIRPNFIKKLSSASAYFDSVNGRIESSWRRSGDGIILETIIPANTTASIYIKGERYETRSGKSVFKLAL